LPSGEFSKVKGIFQAVEGGVMANGGELGSRGFPHPLRGAIGGNALWILIFKLLKFSIEMVVDSVLHDWLV